MDTPLLQVPAGNRWLHGTRRSLSVSRPNIFRILNQCSPSLWAESVAPSLRPSFPSPASRTCSRFRCQAAGSTTSASSRQRRRAAQDSPVFPAPAPSPQVTSGHIIPNIVWRIYLSDANLKCFCGNLNCLLCCSQTYGGQYWSSQDVCANCSSSNHQTGELCICCCGGVVVAALFLVFLHKLCCNFRKRNRNCINGFLLQVAPKPLTSAAVVTTTQTQQRLIMPATPLPQIQPNFTNLPPGTVLAQAPGGGNVGYAILPAQYVTQVCVCARMFVSLFITTVLTYHHFLCMCLCVLCHIQQPPFVTLASSSSFSTSTGVQSQARMPLNGYNIIFFSWFWMLRVYRFSSFYFIFIAF